jgi:uncharacterized protein (TIGR02300 family)
VTKPELGTKRICSSCSAKFYDLNKIPIVCPKCEAVFVPPVLVLARPGRVMYPAPALAKKPAMPDVPEELVPLGETDDEIEVIEPPTEGLDDKKGDGGFIVLEDQDDEEDAAGIIDDGINKDEET